MSVIKDYFCYILAYNQFFCLFFYSWSKQTIPYKVVAACEIYGIFLTLAIAGFNTAGNIISPLILSVLQTLIFTIFRSSVAAAVLWKTRWRYAAIFMTLLVIIVGLAILLIGVSVGSDNSINNIPSLLAVAGSTYAISLFIYDPIYDSLAFIYYRYYGRKK